MIRFFKGRQKSISIISVCLLTLFFTILLTSIGLSIGIFNNKNVIKAIDKSDYFNKAYNRVDEKTEDILSQVGIPVTILSDVITAGKVHTEGANYINARLNNRTWNIPDIHEDIQAHVIDYIESNLIQVLQNTEQNTLQEQNTEQNTLQEQNAEQSIQQSSLQPIDSQTTESSTIHTISTMIEEEYKTAIQIRFIDNLMGHKAKYTRVMTILVPIILILAGLLCYILIRLNRQRYKGVRYIAYTMIGSSLIVALTAISASLSKGYKELALAQDYYKQFVSSYIGIGINVLIYISIMGSIVAVAIISLIKHMRQQFIYGA